MSSASLRVVLDSNAFSATHFAVLASSRMRELCKLRRVVAVYAGEMIDETLRAYLVPGARAQLLKQWVPFILETGVHLFDELPAIWHKELVLAQGDRANVHMSPKKQRFVSDMMRTLPEDGSSALLVDFEPEWKEGSGRRAARRQLSMKMRDAVSKLARQAMAPQGRVVQRNGEDSPFGEFVAEGMIKRFIAPGEWRVVYRRWQRQKQVFPYFTQFVRNVVYQETTFMTDQSAKVDINAQPDLDIMTHLLRADVLVTNEAGFMRNAFEDLWRGRGKTLFTSDEFARHLERM